MSHLKRRSMTYILGARCKDGVVVVADKKIIYDHTAKYQKKIFVLSQSIIVAASGALSPFDNFKILIRDTLKEEPKGLNTFALLKKLEEITHKVNYEYKHKPYQEVFDVLVAIYNPDSDITFQYIYPHGISEEIQDYKAIGEGEPYGSIYLQQLWNQNITMVEAAELGYRIINYIESFGLNESVGVGRDKPQVLFMTKSGLLQEASNSLISRLETSCRNWLQRSAVSIKETYRPSLTVDGYVCIKKWGTQGEGDGQFYYIEGISIDSLGYVYVVAEAPHCVQKFDKNGNFINRWGTQGNDLGQFDVPYGIAIDMSDNIYISDFGNCRVQKFSKDGELILALGKEGKEEREFNGPSDIALDSQGNIYVVEETNHRVQKFDNEGRFKLKWGSEGSQNRQFNHPLGIEIDSSNNVYVADSLNHRIQKFDSEGSFIMKWGEEGNGDGEFNHPHGLTFDSSSTNLYVTDSLNHRIQVFNPEGKFITKWGSKGSDDGQLKVPRGLAVNSAGNVYVSDGANHRVQVFAPSWKHVSELDFFNQER